ncbi:MAG TPA: LysM peptidoglycan-binding domain-containing protein [Acidimicrobiia bacterium]
MASGADALPRVVVLLTALIAAFFLLLASGVSARGDGRATTEVHVVQAGETLWEIAEDLTEVDGDVRRTVFELRALNQLPDSLIMAGDRILIPRGG